jgi:hypothetical protein
MDTFYCSWAFVMCLEDGSPPPILLDYRYCDYPDNVKDGNVPKRWKKLPHMKWEWKKGDIMVFKTNHLHKGPPNIGPNHRYILFGSTAITGGPPNTFTDTSVIFEHIFFGVLFSPILAHNYKTHALYFTTTTYIYSNQAGPPPIPLPVKRNATPWYTQARPYTYNSYFAHFLLC